MSFPQPTKYHWRVLRIFLVGLLILSLFCTVHLMGNHDSPSGHSHHNALASCGTCMGPAVKTDTLFPFILAGVMTLTTAVMFPFLLVRKRFHPPRAW